MIFISTGSRSFQFNRLLQAVDEAVGKGEIEEKVFAQVGLSDYSIKNFEYVKFLNHEKFNEYLKKSDIVLTHGGTGVIVNSIKLGKKVVVIPRLAKYGEAVDDHQIQLTRAFDKLGMITACYKCTSEDIAEAIKRAKNTESKPFKSNTQNIINSIEELIEVNFGKIKRADCKMRVLMCGSARSEKGGMNSVVEQLLNHPWNEDIELTYLASHISGSLIKKMIFFAKAVMELKKHIKNNTFDIAHIHMSYKGSFYRKYIITKLCKKNGKKVVIHLHGSEFKEFYNRGNEKLKRKIEGLFTIVDCTIVLGEDWKAFIEMINEKAKVTVIHNAVKIPIIDETKSNEVITLLFMGALIKRKGVQDLLEAIKQVQMQGISNFEVLIAGSGEEEKNLKQFVLQSDMGSVVKFLGWIDNKRKTEILKKSDLLVLPSYNEGLPVAILEALSYGVPIISTDVGSISEAVEHGYNGFLIKPGDVDALADLIIWHTENRDEIKRLSKNARNKAEVQFGENKFFEKIEAIYCSLVE